MNIIVRVITGEIQDRDNNSYDKVTIVYTFLAAMSVFVSIVLGILSWKSPDLGHLQWRRRTRIARGELLNERRERFYGVNRRRNRNISLVCFGVLILVLLGSWCVYFWGVATGKHRR